MPKYNLTAKPYYLSGLKKPITGAWGIEADSIPDVLRYLADKLEDQPGDNTTISIDRTDKSN